MRSGIAGRADSGTQARQFNATPTPATALHAIPDHGTPRLARQPGLRIASRSRGHCCRDDPHANGRAGAASTLARAWQMNARHTPRRGSPSEPDSLWASRSSDENGTDAHQGCLSSETAGQDSAAGTSRHEVRDRGEGRRRGASPAI